MFHAMGWSKCDSCRSNLLKYWARYHKDFHQPSKWMEYRAFDQYQSDGLGFVVEPCTISLRDSYSILHFCSLILIFPMPMT